MIANHIAERCSRSDTIIDAFCGVGGNAIAFAEICQRGPCVRVNNSDVLVWQINLAGKDDIFTPCIQKTDGNS